MSRRIREATEVIPFDFFRFLSACIYVMEIQRLQRQIETGMARRPLLLYPDC